MKITKISIFVLLFLVAGQLYCPQLSPIDFEQVPEITVNNFVEFNRGVVAIAQQRVGNRRYGMRFPIIVNEKDPTGEGYVKFLYNIRTSYNSYTGETAVFYQIRDAFPR